MANTVFKPLGAGAIAQGYKTLHLISVHENAGTKKIAHEPLETLSGLE